MSVSDISRTMAGIFQRKLIGQVYILCALTGSVFTAASNASDVFNSVPPHIDRLRKLLRETNRNYMNQWTKGMPVNVLVGFYMESISSMKPTEMAFDVDMYFRASWQDERLRHNESKHFTVTDEETINMMWFPDIYFANAKEAALQTVTKPNHAILVFPDGHIAKSTRIISTVACNLDLHNYPMDVQVCEIRMLSYAHPQSQMVIQWFVNNPISYNKRIQLPEMQIENAWPELCDGNYTYGYVENSNLAGEFSCLVAKLRVRRQIGYHLVQTYIPTLLIVTISWISFWIDPSAIPARISLSFTTLLTLATMASGIRTALPPVSYAKAIDYWVGMCMMFVFAALLEFAFVNSLTRRAAKCRNPRKSGASVISMPLLRMLGQKQRSVEEGEEDVVNTEPMGAQELKFLRLSRWVDNSARVLFPGSFLLFNIVYWLQFYTPL